MPEEANVPETATAMETKPAPPVRLDWSAEPPALFANVFSISRFGDVFAFVFADLMPSGDKVVHLPDGSQVMPARPVSSLRVPAYAVQSFMEGLVTHWNAFADELTKSGETNVPKYQRVPTAKSESDAG